MTRNLYWTAVSLIVVAGLALRLQLQHSMGSHFADDAYIFMRYVQNVTEGRGLVYNAGARVIGFTSPLFVLLVCGLHAVLRFLPLAAMVSGLNIFLFIALTLLAVTMRARFGNSLVFVLLLVFYYPYLDASMNGMETMLFVTCIFSCMVSLTRKRPDIGLIAATLAALTRPEGVLFLGIVVAQVLWTRPAPLPWKGFALSALLAGLWVTFALAYYGTVLPQSMLAKATAHTASAGVLTVSGPLDTYVLLAAGFSADALTRLPDEARSVLSFLALVSMPLIVLALISYLRQRDPWAVFPAFFLAVWVFYCIGKPVSIWSWYAIPTSMAFVAGLLPWLLQKLPIAGHAGRRLALEGVVGLLCAGTIAVGLPARVQGQTGMTARLFTEVDYLKQTVPQAKSIMVGDIGIVGYESGLKIVDMAGLVSPEVFNKRPDGQKITFGTLTQTDTPDVLLLREDPRDTDIIQDGLNRTQAWADDAEKARFDQNYMLIDVNYEFFHPFIFVRRSLVNPAMLRAAALPEK